MELPDILFYYLAQLAAIVNVVLTTDDKRSKDSLSNFDLTRRVVSFGRPIL